MTFQDFMDLFNNSSSGQTIALFILLALTFLLGMIVWALIFHLPKTTVLNRENKAIKTRNAALEKENLDIADQLKVQSAKLQRINETLTESQTLLTNKGKEIETKNTEIETLQANLKDSKKTTQNSLDELAELKKLYKYAAAEIKEAEAQVQKAEEAKANAVKQSEASAQSQEEAKKEVAQALKIQADAQQQAKKAQETIDELKGDIERALKHIQKLETEKSGAVQARVDAQNALEALQTTSENLQDEQNTHSEYIKKLHEQVNNLEIEKTALENRLKQYTQAEEEAQKEEKEEDKLLQQYLTSTAELMETHGFYEDFEQKELIDDPQKLEQQLQLNDTVVEAFERGGLGEEADNIEKNIEDEEHDSLERALNEAQHAMNLQGFYNDIEEAILVGSIEQKTPTETEEYEISEEDLMERTLAEMESITDNNGFFDNSIREQDLVDDAEKLKQELIAITEAIEMQEQASKRSLFGNAEPSFEYTQDEETALERSLELAGHALSSEGLFSDIAQHKLVENASAVALENADQTDFINPDHYNTDIEKSVVSEIGRTIPSAHPAQKNDLKKIEGIGLFIEKKLNHLGIYTFEQISHFDTNFIKKLTAAIGFSEEAIARDRWVEQAQNLHKKQQG